MLAVLCQASLRSLMRGEMSEEGVNARQRSAWSCAWRPHRVRPCSPKRFIRVISADFMAFLVLYPYTSSKSYDEQPVRHKTRRYVGEQFYFEQAIRLPGLTYYLHAPGIDATW
jgi:hypothetical protein